MLLHLINFAALLLVFINLSEGRTNDSYEHQLREIMLENSDKIVRPEVKGNDRIPIKIQFEFKLIKLVKVNIKEETITVDSWVIMRWNNTFFSWDPSNYGHTDKINFLPTEIWFPDIFLINNANGHGAKAGGPTFFSSLVMVDNNGLNTWSGPATFTASCNMGLDLWPFDTQSCGLSFGSLAYGSQLLVIEELKTKTGRIENSANWVIDRNVEATISETSFGNCCPFKFSQITFTIEMGRRFEYYIFYMVAPCLSLALLTLISFWIPSESGERIGFVTTLLLGMMVFLLIVPESLPESSESIPVLGKLMMSTMVVIGFALLATIFVLRCYHSTGSPPRFLQCLTKSSSVKKTSPFDSTEIPKTSQADIKLKEVQRIESPEEPPTSEKSSVEDDNRWGASISEKLDKFFFLIFAIVIIILYGSILGPAIANVTSFEE